MANLVGIESFLEKVAGADLMKTLLENWMETVYVWMEIAEVWLEIWTETA